MTDGALATKLQPVGRIHIAETPAPEIASEPIVRDAEDLSRAVQRSLFQDRSSKIVPIQPYPPAATRPRARAEGSPPRPPGRRISRVPEEQGRLDFLPPAPPKPRTLGTNVEAVIYCEAPVATILHRAVAAALDWSMVLIGYGAFLVLFKLLGGEFTLNKANLMVFGGMLPLIALAYGLIWTIAGTETAGMNWTSLRLTTFDGFPPEPKQRILRFAGSCLSLCTVVGLLWSFVDEESLAWQDHISRTFPTPVELESQIVERR
jgi:uncharacterized RDD family membrane protein YckC